jgi:hypothetical protein
MTRLKTAFRRAFGRPLGDYRRDRFAAPTLADHGDGYSC